jgi:KaiC/GvpD/RAD55 family RecA-like ATPase
MTEEKRTSDDLNGRDCLPGNETSQSALLGHLLTNSQFFTQAYQKIQPNWFRNPYHARLYSILCSYYKEKDFYPTLQEFRIYRGFDGLDGAEKKRLELELGVCLNNTQKIRLEGLVNELTMWMHSRILQDQIVRASNAWNKGRYDIAASCLAEAAKAYNETRFNEGEAVRFTEAKTWLSKAETDTTNTLTTGLRLLDRGLIELTPKQEKERELAKAKGVPYEKEPGGLQIRDTTILLAPSNTGKTTTLITIARHNIYAGKSVLFMTHEGAPEDIRIKMLCAAIGKTRGEIMEMYKTEEGFNTIDKATKVLEAFMVYVPFNKAGMKVEDVVPIIRRYQEERAAKNGGKGFDLLVSDYPAKLTTEMASKGNLSTRHIQEVVYENYVQLALEYGFHSLLAIQTNREASRVNSGHYDGKNNSDHRLLTMEDVAESWGPMTSASNVITLNRSPTAKLRDRITFYIAKSRTSQTGLAVAAKSRFDQSLSHAEEFGATAYYGTKTMEEVVDDALRDFRNTLIPNDVYLAAKN